MFVWNVGKIFGHGLVSWTLGVVRFGFSLLTVLAFIGIPLLVLKGAVLHRPEAYGEAGLCLAVAFGAFVVNVAIATVQRKLRIALERSLAGRQERDDAAEPPYQPATSATSFSQPMPAPRRSSARARAWR